jgi:acetyltransferase-like isoleucine patch superfamily enzyme
MSPAFVAKLFLRRMILLKLANVCPLVSGRRFLYRLMGVKVGRDVFIGFGVEVDTNFSELIEIGDHVTISHRCVIVTHMATDVDTPLRRIYPKHAAPVRIHDGAWLCIGAIVLPGVTIGENAVVAAGAVVSRDVEPGMLVAGVPARPVKRLPL